MSHAALVMTALWAHTATAHADMDFVPQPKMTVECGASGCLVGADHGCVVIGTHTRECAWQSVAAAEAGCGAWDECKAFVCMAGGKFCFARGNAALVPTAPGSDLQAYTKSGAAAIEY
eukprot:TRINITY_DN7743_c0_g1_i2.p4 TRINITY_DN7743_c0_g1~~TRINITY_DN7743_c0_g1_i2.p4  ORF type:complete len:118 (+),score=20.01 TRINITY_DN7743_c0_g1_i2:49-402(+)